MLIEIKIPTPGESITEVELGKWLVADGDQVEKDQEVAEIESDKATLTLSATESGQIHFAVTEGDRVAVGTIACTIDTSVSGAKTEVKPVAEMKKEVVSAPEVVSGTRPEVEESKVKVTSVARKMMQEYHLSMEEVLAGLYRISKSDIEAVLTLPKDEGKLTISTSSLSSSPFAEPVEASRTEKREKMTSLRRKLSERLVSVKNENRHADYVQRD